MSRRVFEENEFWIQYGIDLKRRRIMLDEEIDEYSVGWAIRGIKLMEDSSDDPIDIFISSYGGSVYDGLALYDIIVSSPCKIITHALGKVMSMGFLIYLAGVERYALKYATFMNHSISSVSWGKLHELETEYKECKRLEEIALNILEERTSKDKNWWKKRTTYKDEYMDVEKAIEYGIITHVEERE